MNATALPSRPTAADMIEIRRNRPMVSSVKIAEVFGRRHDSVLRAIRTKLIDGLHLRISAEMSIDERGRERPIYWLDERSALIVMPFVGGKHAIDGQRKLVDGYLWYRDHYANPLRNQLLAAKRAAHHPMMDALIEMREEAGKDTDARHFQCENKLVNWLVTGEFKAIDERSLTNSEAELLTAVRRRNESLLLAGLDYDERKRRLTAYTAKIRGQRAITPATESTERGAAA